MRRQGAINLAGALIRIGASGIAVPLTVRLCGIEEFGRWIFLFSLATVLASCDFGLPTTVNVFVSRAFAEREEGVSDRVSYIGLASAVVAVAMGGIAIVLVIASTQIPQTRHFVAGGSHALALAASTGIFVSSRILANVAAAFLQAEGNYAAHVLIGLTFVLPSTIGLPLAASFGFGAAGFLHLNTGASMICFLTYLVPAARLWRRERWQFAFDRREWRQLSRFAVGSWVAGIGGTIFNQCDRLVVAMLLTAEQLGIYAVATQITSQINALSAIPVQPLLPFLSRWVPELQTNLQTVRRLLSDAIRLNTAIALGLSGTIVIFAPELGAIFVPSAQVQAVTRAIRILAIIYGAYSLNAVGFYALFATRDIRRLATVTVGIGLATLVTIGAGAWAAGLRGAVIGNVTYAVTLVLNVFVLRHVEWRVAHWLRIVRVPIAVWAVVVAFASTFDVEGISAEMVCAALLVFTLLSWTVISRRGEDYSLAALNNV